VGEGEWQYQSAYSIPEVIAADIRTVEACDFLPLQPLFPGFAINTVFYSGGLFALCFGFEQGRRIIRLRRGRCPKCAYPMGQSAVCTECGAKLPELRAHSPQRGAGL